MAEEDGYEAWLRSLDDPDEVDPQIDRDAGIPIAGFREFTSEVFLRHGPISREEFEQAFNEKQLALARRAAERVEADIRRTSGIGEIRFDVAVRRIRPDENYQMLVVSLHGSFQTPAMFSLRDPESTAEVADNMQDRVADELHRAWPVCPDHDRGLYARTVDDRAVWYCRSGAHSVAPIGELSA